MGMEPSDLYRYWIIVFAMCIIIRVLSMFLLYVISNDGISWLKNKVFGRFFGYCKRSKSKKKEADASYDVAMVSSLNGMERITTDEVWPFNCQNSLLDEDTIL